MTFGCTRGTTQQSPRLVDLTCMWARTADAPRGGRVWRFLGAWRWLRSLSVAVIGISALLFLATAVAGTASVRSVARQDDLLISEAILADVTADAGRAEALVAQLADPRTNPAFHLR